jgi:magnesium transporter
MEGFFMSFVSTFYLSRVIGNKLFSEDNKVIGKVLDLIVDVSFTRPKVIAVRVKHSNSIKVIDFSYFDILKEHGQYRLRCNKFEDTEVEGENCLYLAKHVLDRQLVDMDGRKLVRVNDIRLAILASGTFVVAVDVGIEGLLRRLGIAKPIKSIVKPLGLSVPSKLILWDEVETIGFGHAGIRLSKQHSKLSTLHPSDLADIIEDLDRKTQAAIFASMDDERAADVLEELETEAQINVLESMSVDKAADVLEKMPADEVADILDEMEEEKAEELLSVMENEASEEVRELMEYPDNTVGSLMTTEYISFHEDMTVEETISELRRLKPESESIYYLYVLDNKETLVATVSLRDIVVSEPQTRLYNIMKRKVISVLDYDKIDSLADIISKYSLLAIPVVDEEMKMQGVVVIDDVVYELLKRKRRRA